MSDKRRYRPFAYRDASYRVCCSCFDQVVGEIVRLRNELEAYGARHPEFIHSFAPVAPFPDAPPSAVAMARAAALAGVGPLAAVAGTIAQLAAEAGIAAGAEEAIVDNGGDIFMVLKTPATIGVYAGPASAGNRLGFAVEPAMTPLAVCASSGTMGHSTSLGQCDLAIVVAPDGALADAVATLTANRVRDVDDIENALETAAALPGVSGAVVIKNNRFGMIGQLPPLVRIGK